MNGDDVSHGGLLVLFLPGCLDPAQMFHIVSYLARTLFFLQQFEHVELLQDAFQCAALPRPADFLREQEKGCVFDLGEVRIALRAKAEFFCHSDFPEVICEAAARKSERHPLVKTDCCTYHDSVQPHIKISMSHRNTPFLMNQNHRFACPARRSCLLAILSYAFISRQTRKILPECVDFSRIFYIPLAGPSIWGYIKSMGL